MLQACASLYGLLVLPLLLTPSFSLIPQPVSFGITPQYYRLPLEVGVQHNAPYCFTLHASIKRLLESFNLRHLVRDLPSSFAGNITHLVINVSSECIELMGVLYPREGSKEDYQVIISSGVIWINASEKYLPNVRIVDRPRWPFRSFLIDTSRHFIPLQYILQFLKAMATVKMNVLHWHMVDDQSFPYESYTFPKLSEKGAYSRTHATYTQQDVRIVIEYARSLGIRVMPEIDTPGHTRSWGYGYPTLLTPCFSRRGPTDDYGPLNPIKNATYDFVGQLIGEIAKTFPDSALHLGGDEVDFACWKSNPEIRDFMVKMGFNSSYTKLENYYFVKLLNKVKEVTNKTMKIYVWQEIFDDGVEVNDSTTVHVWKNEAWRTEMDAVTRAGKEVVFSACWYLSSITYGEDWIKHYQCDPASFTNNTKQLALVKGGGAAMWGEYVDHTNLISRSWPRGAAVAERLWSPAQAHDIHDMRIRLISYRCFLLAMGLNSEPITGPDYCDFA
ncbi:Beta-hexosaminidase subunit beta [Taenia crassiceps]|uniref:beta-N-acetylhexosaminidase n=1 Tax=Taenia crassiceps TaxID=6207 RepID=A0ABR4QS48_9CEST